MTELEKTGPAAVYVSWPTFKNALDQFSQGVPNQIDRSVFPGMAWGVQNQFFAGLKFLGLTDDKGKPTAALNSLATADEAARKQVLKGILEKRYADLFALDLTKATPTQITDQITKSYNVNGATRDKAIRFFLGAADYAGVELSSLLKPKGSTNGTAAPRKRRGPARVRVPSTVDQGSLTDELGPHGTKKIVSLKSGGALTLTASLDLFALLPSDRKFVFELIDKLEEYEKATAGTGKEVEP